MGMRVCESHRSPGSSPADLCTGDLICARGGHFSSGARTARARTARAFASPVAGSACLATPSRATPSQAATPRRSAARHSCGRPRRTQGGPLPQERAGRGHHSSGQRRWRRRCHGTRSRRPPVSLAWRTCCGRHVLAGNGAGSSTALQLSPRGGGCVRHTATLAAQGAAPRACSSASGAARRGEGGEAGRMAPPGQQRGGTLQRRPWQRAGTSRPQTTHGS